MANFLTVSNREKIQFTLGLHYLFLMLLSDNRDVNMEIGTYAPNATKKGKMKKY